MKFIENLVMKACAYTVLILSLFYLFGTLSNFSAAYINFPTFLIVFAFGIVIAIAGLLLNLKKLKKWLRILLHYTLLLMTFCVVFIIRGNLSAGGSSTIFSAIIIFTALYFAIFGIVYLIKRTVKSADKTLDKYRKADVKTEKTAYKSLYKNED